MVIKGLHKLSSRAAEFISGLEYELEGGPVFDGAKIQDKVFNVLFAQLAIHLFLILPSQAFAHVTKDLFVADKSIVDLLNKAFEGVERGLR